MKMWLIFCGGMEILICYISKLSGYGILKFELLKCVLYFILCIILNVIMRIKKWEKDTILCMNCGVSLILSSLSGAIFATFFLEEKGKDVGWILFLVAYIGTLILFFWMWKEGNVVNEESKVSGEEVAKKRGWIIGMLATMTFVRSASENGKLLFFEILLIILIWLLAFSSILFFVRCKYDIKKMNQNN